MTPKEFQMTPKDFFDKHPQIQIWFRFAGLEYTKPYSHLCWRYTIFNKDTKETHSGEYKCGLSFVKPQRFLPDWEKKRFAAKFSFISKEEQDEFLELFAPMMPSTSDLILCLAADMSFLSDDDLCDQCEMSTLQFLQIRETSKQLKRILGSAYFDLLHVQEEGE